MWIPRLFNAKFSRVCRNRLNFRLFRYTIGEATRPRLMCILEPCGAAIKNAASLPAKEGTIFQVRNYVIKRILLSFVILFCVTFIIYVMMRSLPSSFAENMAMQLSQAPGAKPYQEWLDQLNAAYGLDKGILPGFMTWLSSAVHGQFGDSWKWNVPVVQKFQEVIGLSVVMGGISFVLSMIIAVPLGILAATKQYSRTDYVITAVALVGISLPSFFFATLLKLLFSVKLGWFDLYGLVGRDYAQLSSWGQFCDRANHLVLPIVTLVIVSIGSTMRYTRTNMLEVLNADYIRTARAKGVPNSTIWFRHVFRNSVVPMVNLIPGSILLTISGSIYVESLYSIPGMGGLLVDVIKRQDNNMVLALVVIFAVMSILGLLLGDLLMAVVDPRISFTKKEGSR